MCVLCPVAQLYPALCNPMDCSPPGCSVDGIFQARILEWVAISSSRGSSQPRDRIRVSCISCIGRQILYHWATRETLNMCIDYVSLYFFIYLNVVNSFYFFSFIFISWGLITLQYCSGFCHTLTWISHRFTCIPHPGSPSHLPLYPIPLGLPSH